ncbi:glycosyltransferase family 9 protein [Pasteurellaceae bacterium 22721_9_1]
MQSEQFQNILALSAKAESLTEQLTVLQAYDRFIQNYPDSAAAYQNRSDLLQKLGLYQLAWQDAEKVTELAPDFALGHCNKAFLLNLFGHYEQGWAEYEWRFKTDIPTFKDPGWPISRWQGETIEQGKLLLIHAEQGLGDNIQFVRLAILAKQRGLPVVVVNHSPVENLLNHNLALHDVDYASNGSAIADLACYCSMMSLPHYLDLRLDNIPFSDGYLQAEPLFFAKWQEKLRSGSKRTRLKIGVVWSGSAKHNRNKTRSLQFAQFSQLFGLDADFHCLQKEVSEVDLACSQGIDNLHFWHNEINDFSDTAGLVAQMDLVISVDTSVAHLAAAMGKPTWIMISYHPDFRWLLNRNDSPWYRSVQLFRQDNDQNWLKVVQNIYKQLEKEIGLIQSS